MSDKALLEVLKEDGRSITYRPQYAEMLGSVTAAILLQQIHYWWGKSGDKPFWKYRDECNADDYKPGDSWLEELGFKPREFDNALKVIGTKIKKGDDKKELLSVTEPPMRYWCETDASYLEKVEESLRHLVLYWTDKNRKTYYLVNEQLLANYVRRNYEANYVQRKRLVITVNANTMKLRRAQTPNNSKLPETTKEKDIAADAAQPFEAGNGLQHDFANDEAGSTVVVADPTPEEVEADIAACEEKDLRGELFEAIAKGFFNLTSTEGLDRTSAARIGKLVKWLMELDTPATVDELRQFWKAYKIKYGGIDLPRTIEKLSLHFQEFRQDGLKPNLTIIAHPSHRPAQLDTQQEQAPEVVAANLAMLDDLDAVEPSMEESA